jgi:hypothetical protein
MNLKLGTGNASGTRRTKVIDVACKNANKKRGGGFFTATPQKHRKDVNL